MRVPLLDLVAQHERIQDHVIPAIMQVVARQSFVMGPEVGQLEQRIAELSGVKHAIACASGTDALLLSLKVLDLAPRDEVITPAFTTAPAPMKLYSPSVTPQTMVALAPIVDPRLTQVRWNSCLREISLRGLITLVNTQLGPQKVSSSRMTPS